MKKILSITAACLSLLWCSTASAQDVQTVPDSPKDTLSINFLKHTDPGDLLPFKYIYQRARISQDTTITCSITKDVLFEVLENNKEEEYVLVNITQTNFQKTGPESKDPLYNRVSFYAEGLPVEITIGYDGRMYGSSDSLVSRAIRNLNFVADTLSSSVVNTEKLSRDAILESLSNLVDTGYVMSEFVADLSPLFFPGEYKFIANESYTIADSILCDIDNKYHPDITVFAWDDEFSRENEQFRNLYVIRKFNACDPMLFIERLDPDVTEDEAKELIEKYGRRLISAIETTILADRGIGIPILVDMELVNGFYEQLGDDYLSLSKIMIALDTEKLAELEGDDDEEEEDNGEPRYDDYGFIKVK